ncbi:MAG: DUF87 domain-containing protein [Nitrososphaerales archaeon]
MKLLNKSDDEVSILCLPKENLAKGDYLLIEGEENKAMIVQVYDLSYYNLSGFEEDIIREEVIMNILQGVEKSSPLFSNITETLKDLILAKCKIRNYRRINCIPSRSKATIRKLQPKELDDLINDKNFDSFLVGYLYEKYPYHITLDKLDGSLNLITGKKGSGKSHLAKVLISGLLRAGAKVIIFDLNNEYSGLVSEKDEQPNEQYQKVLLLEPGKSLRFTFEYLGLKSVCDVLQNILELPTISLREFIRIWEYLEQRNLLTLYDFINFTKETRLNDFIKEAIISRLHTLLLSNLITERNSLSFEFEDLLNKEEGIALIFSLASLNPLYRKMVVELALSKLTDLLEKNLIPPLFLFAEEAHLYLRETYWDDMVTRMRHFGIFTTFITNQPKAIKESILKQLDNLFIFKLVNTSDIDFLSNICNIDSDSIRALVKDLRLGECLALGKVSKELPLLISVIDTPFKAMGETKLFFKKRPFSQKLNISSSFA